MRTRCPEHGIPDCSPLLNGCSWQPKHVLVVTGTWADEGEMEVEHLADCPREHSDAGYWFFTCEVGQLESDMGLDANFAHEDDPDPFYRAEKLAPGRYEIEPWFETHPGGPWGPTEYSAGLCVVPGR